MPTVVYIPRVTNANVSNFDMYARYNLIHSACSGSDNSLLRYSYLKFAMWPPGAILDLM